jgi:IPT/TIG domain
VITVGFSLFPDPPVKLLAIPANATADSVFPQRAGAPPPDLAGVYAQVMFVRVAMIGGTVVPELVMTAGTGPPVVVTTEATAMFRESGIGGGVGFVGDVSLTQPAGNVVEIMVGFDQVSTETWKLGIHNNDPTTDRLYTWVVADSAAEAAQPWVDPATFAPSFAESEAEQFVPDSGMTGTSVTLSGNNFHIGQPQLTFGAIPATLTAAPTPTSLTVAVPAGLAPDSATPITVTTDAGTATSALKFHFFERHVVLIGDPHHSVDAIAQILTTAGCTKVSTDPATVTDTTELVATVVSCTVGPMPATRSSILGLAGHVLARAAIVITKVDLVIDQEIQALVQAETLELLALPGITPLDADQVIKSPTQNVAAEIKRILSTPPRNYHVVAPP